MNTPSHLIINAVIEKNFGGKLNIAKSAFLWGAVIPDIPLGVLSLVATLYYRIIVGYQSPDLMEAVLHPLYFNDPIWISAHSVLHSQLALGLYLVILWRWRNKPSKVQPWLFWFFVGCALHTGIDILTHYDDGPLLLWPLNWQLRFHSPISYWDPAHFGSQFFVFELLLDALLIGYLAWPALKRRIGGLRSQER